MNIYGEAHVVMVLVLVALTLSAATFDVAARPVPNFGQRRLLNLSGDSNEFLELPPALVVPLGNELLTCYKAEGAQEYMYNGTDWQQKNVSAELSSFAGEIIGQHFYLPEKDALGGQPSWQSFSPMSLVTAVPVSGGSVVMSMKSIPWVTLEVTATSGALDYFGAVTFVQRLFTSEGIPPSTPGKVGDVFQSPYSATYCFYKKGS